MLQPFEFLGVTPNTSVADLRKRYFELALICHPDKGGSHEDMIVLHTAYKWVEEQLRMVERREHQSFEDCKESFEAFMRACSKQEIAPSFLDVPLEAYGYVPKDIRDWFDAHAQGLDSTAYGHFENLVKRDVYTASLSNKEADLNQICSYVLHGMQSAWNHLVPASIPAGYGEYMVGGNTSVQPTPFGTRDVILHQEQMPYEALRLYGTHIAPPTEMEDYTISGNVPGCDYKDAYTEFVFPDCPQYREPFEPVETKLELAEVERGILNMKM